MSKMKVVPLGAGQDVGRSCILLSIGGRNVMLDCGMHMGFNDERCFPDFSFISGSAPLTNYIDCVIITHFHLDHCGALPYMSETVGYNGPIYMTYPTKAIVPVMLEDYRKVQVESKNSPFCFTQQMIKNCMRKTIGVNIHEEVNVFEDLTICAYYAGHVLGAAMFLIKVGEESVLYTGDYNMTADRHLGAARVRPGLCPDLLITETTYATTIRDSKRAREGDFLKKVHDCVINGGKVLIPVFALGRAQELCILLDTYWERKNLAVPIYCSQGLAERATQFFRFFTTWMNENMRRCFYDRNLFDYKHIKPFDNSYVDSPGPMVLFSPPGMLHGGQSLRIFKRWCSDPNNMIVMPGFCTSGTVGAKVIAGAKTVEIDGDMVDVRLSVEYMSFSAHADAKGILQLIRICEPKNVMFVHGENAKMEFLKARVEEQFKIEVFKPANGESIDIWTEPKVELNVPMDVVERSLSLDPTPSKRFCPFHAVLTLDAEKKDLNVISTEDAAKHLGVKLHKVEFVNRIEAKISDWEKIVDRLKEYDSSLFVSEDGVSMFNGEIRLRRVDEKRDLLEVVYDESREPWYEVIKTSLTGPLY